MACLHRIEGVTRQKTKCRCTEKDRMDPRRKSENTANTTTLLRSSYKNEQQQIPEVVMEDYVHGQRNRERP